MFINENEVDEKFNKLGLEKIFVRILSERFNINEESARRHFRNMYEQKKALMIKPLNETISKLNEIDREEPGKLEKMLAEQNEKK